MLPAGNAVVLTGSILSCSYFAWLTMYLSLAEALDYLCYCVSSKESCTLTSCFLWMLSSTGIMEGRPQTLSLPVLSCRCLDNHPDGTLFLRLVRDPLEANIQDSFHLQKAPASVVGCAILLLYRYLPWTSHARQRWGHAHPSSVESRRAVDVPGRHPHCFMQSTLCIEPSCHAVVEPAYSRGGLF